MPSLKKEVLCKMKMASAIKINLSLALSKILKQNFKDGW